MCALFPPDTEPESRSVRDSTSDGSNAGSASSGAARTLLLVAAGAVAVAYVVSRLAGSRDGGDEPSLESVQERAVGAVPAAVTDRVPDAVLDDPQPIPIGGRGSDDESDSTADADASDGVDAESARETGDAENAADPITDAEANADLADEPSPTKITSSSDDEIQDEPAEPGEMAVEDDIEELVDDELVDADEGESESAPGSEADETDDDVSTDEA